MMNFELIVVSLFLIYLVMSTNIFGQSFLRLLRLEDYSINQMSIGLQLIVILFSSLYVFNFPTENIFHWNLISIILILMALIIFYKKNVKIKFSYGQILILIFNVLVYLTFFVIIKNSNVYKYNYV